MFTVFLVGVGNALFARKDGPPLRRTKLVLGNSIARIESAFWKKQKNIARKIKSYFVKSKSTIERIFEVPFSHYSETDARIPIAGGSMTMGLLVLLMRAFCKWIILAGMVLGSAGNLVEIMWGILAIQFTGKCSESKVLDIGCSAQHATGYIV